MRWRWLSPKTRVPLVAWLLASVFVLLAPAAAGAQGQGASNDACLRCHSMGTLGYLDAESHRLVDLSVDAGEYSRSNHAALDCVSCHQAGYDEFPHPEAARSEDLYCLDCHNDDPRFEEYRFPQVEEEIRRSVHHQKLGDAYSCFECHDPHEFKISTAERSVVEVVAYDNAICLSCHASPVEFGSLTSRPFVELDTSHGWLPNAKLHRDKVRCIDCHTPALDRMSHEVLPAAQAQRDCVACHSADAVLLTTLYKHRVQEERQVAGFINSVVLNEAYVIGLTRNLFLDRLSLVILSLAALGIFAHGTGRWIRRKTTSR